MWHDSVGLQGVGRVGEEARAGCRHRTAARGVGVSGLWGRRRARKVPSCLTTQSASAQSDVSCTRGHRPRTLGEAPSGGGDMPSMFGYAASAGGHAPVTRAATECRRTCLSQGRSKAARGGGGSEGILWLTVTQHPQGRRGPHAASDASVCCRHGTADGGRRAGAQRSFAASPGRAAAGAGARGGSATRGAAVVADHLHTYMAMRGLHGSGMGRGPP